MSNLNSYYFYTGHKLYNDFAVPGPNTFNENETIAKYEIMDGAPVRGESIPIRVFLAGYELTPTMKDINKKFSVRYYVSYNVFTSQPAKNS